MPAPKLNARMFTVSVVVFYALSALMAITILSTSVQIASVLSVMLLIPLYLWYRIATISRELRDFHSKSIRLAVFLPLLLFGLAMSVRAPFVVDFHFPLEKTPLIFLLLLTLTFAEKYSTSSFGFSVQKLLRNVLLGITLYLAVRLVIDVLYFAFGLIPIRGYDLVAFLFAFPFATFAVGIAEEGLFRGYMQTKFSSITGPWKAILLQAVLFGLWHLVWHIKPLRLGDMAIHVAATFLFGVLAGAYFRYTRNLTSLVLLHGLWDSVPAGFKLVSSSFTPISISTVVKELFAGNIISLLTVLLSDSSFVASSVSIVVGIFLVVFAKKVCAAFGLVCERPLGVH